MGVQVRVLSSSSPQCGKKKKKSFRNFFFFFVERHDILVLTVFANWHYLQAVVLKAGQKLAIILLILLSTIAITKVVISIYSQRLITLSVRIICLFFCNIRHTFSWALCKFKWL